MPRKKKNNELSVSTSIPAPLLKIEQREAPTFLFAQQYEKVHDCEWCFQFDKDEPHVFASTRKEYTGNDAKISFTLTNTSNSGITFKDIKTGKELTIFARKKIYEN